MVSPCGVKIHRVQCKRMHLVLLCRTSNVQTYSWGFELMRFILSTLTILRKALSLASSVHPKKNHCLQEFRIIAYVHVVRILFPLASSKVLHSIGLICENF